MSTPRLFYIGTSKIKEIRKGASITGYDWGTWGSWTNFKKPVAAQTSKVKFSSTATSKVGSEKYGGLGQGKAVLGTVIPKTASRIISGIEKPDCEVCYYQRGYTEYEKTPKLTKDKKMIKRVYTKDKPKQYRLRYKDKPLTVASYSEYIDGIDYIYFANHYYLNEEQVPVADHLPHPTEFKVRYSDVRRNLESTANNSERDNSGSYVFTNVRANIVTLEILWDGLPPEQAADLLDTLNPSKDTKGKYNYLQVQYLDPAQNKVLNKVFFASDRACEAISNGWLRSISVTLTEV